MIWQIKTMRLSKNGTTHAGAHAISSTSFKAVTQISGGIGCLYLDRCCLQ